jgi:hypothetical protein
MTGRVPYEELGEEDVTARYGRGEFPDVWGLGPGRGIEGCWTGELKSAEDVLLAMVESG